MKLLADLHTHSKYSSLFHGKNTIEEMVITANELGLVEIAITDHGYKHWCGTNVFNLLKAREEIDEINKWSKTKVLLGIEADIISEDGMLDIDEEALMLIDVLIIGYHRLIKTDFVNYFGKQKKTKEAIRKATNAFLNAIEKFPVTIVSHLDSILTTDLYKIGKACAEKGVMVEINNRHCNWTEKQVNELLASGCMFVVSSDAHRREDVGVVNKAFRLIKKYDIPRHLIANVDASDEIEKSDDEIEVDQYYSLYLAKKNAKEEKEKALENKKKTHFTNSLSEEMEDKLREIAKEQGLHYEEVPDEDDLIDEFNNYKMTFKETEDIIKSAKEMLEKDTLYEFDSENESVEGDSNYIVIEDESGHLGEDLLKDEGDMTRLNESNDDSFEQKSSIIQNNEQPAKEMSEDEKVLSVMQKTDRVVAKPAVQSSKKGTVVIEANAPKQRAPRRPVAGGDSINTFMNSIKGIEPEKVEKKPEKPAIPAAKKGRGGVFIQMNNIPDDKNDNN